MGQHASDTAQIFFENCRVPASAMMGQEGAGYKIALSNLGAGWIGIAAQTTGMARAAFEAGVRYAKERETFGKLLAEHQAVNFRLADMATQLDAARLMVWRLMFQNRTRERSYCSTSAARPRMRSRVRIF